MKTTYHRDGTVTLWNPYAQQWIRCDAGEILPSILATLTTQERDRVSRMLNKGKSNTQRILETEIVGIAKPINGWTASWEHPGYIMWSNPDSEKRILATPFHATPRTISVEVVMDDGDLSDWFEIPMKRTNNLDADAKEYLRLMTENWSKIEQILNRRK